ncbi:DMT family transporter [Seonamhaeicola marinus]|uniref:DMT family transporter n=1 Tax=Seonamhaeicola marinus TaxID=1912246 RepID=A0A5D0I6U4_9FLAO|nr:DMT family transporter [Seonamhaeicola marinus]TYA78580.1 DMT family transporter [Seonamhaeicola marinus]
MKQLLIQSLALFGGMFLAIQAGFNAQLGSILKQPLAAVFFTSLTSTILGGAIIFFLNGRFIKLNIMNQVPWYLWFAGGVFSVLGISLYFFTIPKLGISKMIAIGLCGQLFFSLIAGQYGWLNLPVEPITIKRALGSVFMIIAIILINTK